MPTRRNAVKTILGATTVGSAATGAVESQTELNKKTVVAFYDLMFNLVPPTASKNLSTSSPVAMDG
jgi:hypothetical protein